MARQVRIEYAGATYHVICRGERKAIYKDDDDRRIFLATLATTVQRTGWRVHAYVLMRDHYHLLIETPKPNLVRGMSWLQTTSTVQFNARHHRRGRLFSGRYKAILVDLADPRYVATLLDYIHLNPVRAGAIRSRTGKHLLDYHWSSLRGYIRKRERPEWLAVQRGFAAKDLEDTVAGRRRLLDELARRAGEGPARDAGFSLVDQENLQSTLRRGWYYGPESFRERLLKKANASGKRPRSSRRKHHGNDVADHGEAEARHLIAQALAQTRMTRHDLTKLSKGDVRKAKIAARVRAATTVPLQWLADQLHMGTAGNVAQACRRIEMGT